MPWSVSTPTATPTSRDRPPQRRPIATTISNDTTGYAEVLAWIVDHAPGPRLVVSIEGTRSYGIGLARAAAAAGLLVVECEQPHRNPPRQGQVRPDRRAPGRADRAAPGRRPAAHPARRRRPRGAADPARRPPGDSPPPAPRRPTGCGRCCWPATTPTAASPAARSPRPAWPAWPGAGHPARPAGSRPYGTPRSAASPSRCARPPARSRPTAPSCRPSSTTSPPG